ncbi:UNVERIFIED_CONTAM: hypothetical protein PYX00_005420 [Menopon gallinae]|uniref:Tetraspanin n=1 Tax=Menopon gallinae TaxID=328185 RepID=A0AAW2HSY2_9NEOP
MLQVSGVGLIIAGAVLLRDVDDFGNFLGNETTAPPIVLIVVGVIVFVIAFFGCCGAIRESYNMLMAFAFLLLIIFIIELAVGIAAAVNKETAKEKMKEAMRSSKNSFDGMNEEHRKIWAQLQSKLECCGVDGPDDWKTGPGNLGSYYPESCCQGATESSRDGLCGPSKEYVYSDGCFDKLSMRLREGSIIVMGVGIGIAMIELAGIVLACLLASAIKKESEDEEKE